MTESNLPSPLAETPGFIQISEAELEDTIRAAPGVIAECWVVVSDDDPQSVLFVAGGSNPDENSRLAHERTMELVNVQPGRSFSCTRAIAKFGFGLLKMPLSQLNSMSPVENC